MKKLIPFLVIGAGAVYFFRDKIFGSSLVEKSNTGSSSSGSSSKSPVAPSNEIKLTKSQKIRSMAVKGIEGLKYDYELVIQQFSYGGWDDVDFYECNSSGNITSETEKKRFKANKLAYRVNMKLPVRVIFRKTKKPILV